MCWMEVTVIVRWHSEPGLNVVFEVGLGKPGCGQGVLERQMGSESSIESYHLLVMMLELLHFPTTMAPDNVLKSWWGKLLSCCWERGSD